MQTVTISLTQVSQVQNFVNLVNQFPYDVDMVSGRYTVNAKSMLGIYSLYLSKPLQVLIYSDDCEELKNTLERFSETQQFSKPDLFTPNSFSSNICQQNSYDECYRQEYNAE